MKSVRCIAKCACLLLLPTLVLAEDCSIASGTAPDALHPPERRFALVVGNANYNSTLGALPDAIDSAKAFANQVALLGFDVVCGTNLNKQGFIDLIKQFRSRIDTADAGSASLFFYAGHGIQVEHENYLVPLSAKLPSPADIAQNEATPHVVMRAFSDETIPLEQVMTTMLDANNIGGHRFVILDAAHNNPYGIGWGHPKLLFNINGMNWLFGSNYDSTVATSNEQTDHRIDSPFVKHLLAALQMKDLPFTEITDKVIADVSRNTQQQQTPVLGGSPRGGFIFNPSVHPLVQSLYYEVPAWQKLIYLSILLLLCIGGWKYYQRKCT